MASAVDVHETDDGDLMIDFCECHASSSAQNFVKHFLDFNRSTSYIGKYNDPYVYAKKFTEFFLHHFDEVLKKSSFTDECFLTEKGDQSKSVSSQRWVRQSEIGGLDSENIVNNGADPSSKSTKRIFRRFSLKNIRKSSRMFLRPASVDLKSNVEQNRSHSISRKHGHINIRKEANVHPSGGDGFGVIKEGIVHVLNVDDSKGKSKWQKCRLVLLRSSIGYLLEFYTPPKSLKPRSGIFCMLIDKARQTTALEMPDRENTMVLKGEHLEYVLEVPDASELHLWIQAIQKCIMLSCETQCRVNALKSMRPRLPTAPTGSVEQKDANQLCSAQLSSSHYSLTTSGVHLSPDMHFRRPWSMIPRRNEGLPSNHRPDPSLFDHRGCSTMDDNLDGSVTARLEECPWFHGTLSRTDAAKMVLLQGPSGHGMFLLRKSETRSGEYVLTFNFQGRAKHLRLTISAQHRCRVQHLWFDTVFDMLEHFRTHPIPLESGGLSDVTLTEYIPVVMELPPADVPALTSAAVSRDGTTDMARTTTVSRSGDGDEDVECAGVSSGSSTPSNENVVVHRDQLADTANQTGQLRAVNNHYSFV